MGIHTLPLFLTKYCQILTSFYFLSFTQIERVQLQGKIVHKYTLLSLILASLLPTTVETSLSEIQGRCN